MNISKCICGSDKIETTVRRKEIVYNKCTNCGTLYQPSFDIQLIMQQYEDEIPERTSISFEEGLYKRDKKFWEELNIFPFTEKTLLDIGCACGVFLDVVSKEKDWILYGIDINPLAIQKAKEKGLTNVIVGEFPFIDFGRKFEIITMFEVVEHLIDPAIYLKKARELCKYLVVTIPCIDYAKDYERFMGEMLRRDHLWIFSEKGIIGLLERTGFVIKSIKETKYQYEGNLMIICK